MSVPRRPLLASTIESPDDLASLQFPVWISRKLDGIRAITTGSGVVSRTLKPIPNKFIQSSLSELPEGIEGELCKVAKDGSICDFEDTDSAVMTEGGKPRFKFFAFDYFSGNRFEPFKQRIKNLEKLNLGSIVIIKQNVCYDVNDVKNGYKLHVEIDGAEGIMIRDPDGFYKFGRSTLKEQLLIKYKPWNTDEAQVLDVLEEFENNNLLSSDERGYAKRSKHIANLQGKGTMGALLVRSKKFGEFKIGSGWTAQEKKDIWTGMMHFINRGSRIIVQYRYRGLTKYGKPRHTGFVRWIN